MKKDGRPVQQSGWPVKALVEQTDEDALMVAVHEELVDHTVRPVETSEAHWSRTGRRMDEDWSQKLKQTYSALVNQSELWSTSPKKNQQKP